MKEKETSSRIFDRIHKRYDLLNRLLSFGRDISWRNKLSRLIDKRDNQLLLDLAAGTGDVAFSFLKHAPQVKHVHGCDMSRNMLETARVKAIKKKMDSRITFIQGDASCIPYKNDTFDVITMAFGIRNVPDPSLVLKEMKRVLKQDGKVLVLEFSLPANPLLKKLHLFYLRNIIPYVGAVISRDKHAYRYLNRTIETFPYGESFCAVMKEAGFPDVRFIPLTFGAATIYRGEKEK
jgi:demethylmenaquinone methyltransferase / 2-methoxy-6-polyprenyl-1,4-benzoquinol methylase